jgi:hypothetical protein
MGLRVLSAFTASYLPFDHIPFNQPHFQDTSLLSRLADALPDEEYQQLYRSTAAQALKKRGLVVGERDTHWDL